MRLLAKALEDKHFILGLEAQDIPSIIRSTIDRLVEYGAIPADSADDVVAALLEREEHTSTAIGNAVAIPHAYLDACPEPVIAFVRLARPVNLGAPDGVPTQFVFFLIGPRKAAALHLDLLANIARLMANDEFRFDAGQARSGHDLLEALQRFVYRTTPATRAQPEPDASLVFTRRIFGGLVGDVRRRMRHYASDFRDGLHPKCVGSTLFLLFACLAPAITFGGVMAVQTGGSIGVVEMLVATAISGVVYTLLSGQPLIILGGTGPVLIFTAVLFRLCNDLSIPFLPAYAWVGIWSAVIMLILAATDASALMRYFTRFTDETFAALVSLIFIYDAVAALVKIFRDLDVNKHHDTALLSLLLAVGTFYIAVTLFRMRRSRYLLPKLREFLADFGPTIAMVVMTLVAFWMHEVDLDTMTVPEGIGTTTGRPWLVSLFDVPTWVCFAAIGPAAIVAVLMYLVQNITGRLINNADHNLRKGSGYHLDLAVIGVLMGLCSLFGLPWLVAATVRSLNHVRSLATIEEVTRGGETRERILHVRETRVTGLAIHVLIGVSLLLLPVISFVPLAVLYGLFLFMGVVSMSGNQFFERLRLWAMEPASYPSTHYIRRVPVWVIHKFTLVQLACLVILWTVMASAWAIVYPLFIALTVPVRVLLDRIIDKKHLEALDAESEPAEEVTHWTG